MKKDKKPLLYKKEEQIKWFNSIDIEEFAVWIKNFLMYGWRDNIVVDIGRADRDIILKDYFYSVDDTRFKENFRKAILRLLLQWNRSHDDISLLFEVLNIIGWTRNIDCFDKLLIMALNENLKNVTYKDINMHERLLAVLFGLGKFHNGIKTIVKRDIKDYRFTQLCFRKNWEMTGNIADSIDYLPDLFICGKKLPSARSTFYRFVTKIGIPNFEDKFGVIWKSLDNVEDKMSLLSYVFSTEIYRKLDENTVLEYIKMIGISKLSEEFESIWKNFRGEEEKNLFLDYLCSTGLYYSLDISKIKDENIIFEITDMERVFPINQVENTMWRHINSLSSMGGIQ
ncbi:MAG: hypothetical protein PVF58_00440 [Candidatus Methanofastidiosia archaeon]|jgi:hypothetical protein